MCYTKYDEWVEYINCRYKSDAEAHQNVGFSRWIKNLIDTDSGIKADFDEFVKYRQNEREPHYDPNKINSKSGKPMYNANNDLPDFIAKIISHAFYEEELPNDKFGHKEHRRVRAFNHDDNNWKNIRNYCSAENQIQLNIIDIDPYYSWVVICSAFQKQYGIFKSLDDLNKFVFDVGNMKKPKGIQNYGFYVRDLNELCLGYSILHGYSLEQYYSLYERCKGTKHSSKVTSKKATRTEEANEYFKSDLYIENMLSLNENDLQKSEADFVAHVEAHRDIFLTESPHKEIFSHWTALKENLLDFTNRLTSDTIAEVDKKNIDVEHENTFQERIGTLWQNLSNILGIDLDKFSTVDVQSKIKGKLFLEKDTIAQDGSFVDEEESVKINDEDLIGYILYRLGLHNFCLISEANKSLLELAYDNNGYKSTIKGYGRDLERKQEELKWRINNITKKYDLPSDAFDNYSKEYLERYYDELVLYNANKNKEKMAEPKSPILDYSQFCVKDNVIDSFKKDVKSFLSCIKKIFTIKVAINTAQRNINKTQKSQKRITDAIQSIIDDALRCILIISIMKDSSDQKMESVSDVLEIINNTLIDYKFRGIDSYENPSKGGVNNKEKDLFDWVVAEAINLEYKEQQDVNNTREVISGFDTIQKLLLNGLGLIDAETSL